MQTGVNQMKKSLMFLIVFTVICWVETGHTFESWTGETTAAINMRISPGIYGKKITLIPKGKIGFVNDKHGDWYQIIVEYETYGYKGWVYGKYIKKVGSEARDNSELISAPYESLSSPKNPPLAKESGTKQPTEKEPLKPLTEKSPMVDSSEKEGEKIELIDASQEDRPSSPSPPVAKKGEKIEPIDMSQKNRPTPKSPPAEKKMEERKSMIVAVSKNSDQHIGWSSLNGLFLIVLSIALLCFAPLHFYRVKRLKETNDDLIKRLRRIKTYLDGKKVGLKENREHPRFSCLIEADFVVEERAYKGFIENISFGGAYIETSETFSVGQEIVLAFQSPNTDDHIKVIGEITRTDAFGIATLFENPI
jgi:uncharacterized protein YraI